MLIVNKNLTILLLEKNSIIDSPAFEAFLRFTHLRVNFQC